MKTTSASSNVDYGEGVVVTARNQLVLVFLLVVLRLDHAQDLISVRSRVADHHGFLCQGYGLLLSSLRAILVVHRHWAKCRLLVCVDLVRHLGETKHLAPVLLGWCSPCLDRGPGRLPYVDSGSL